MEHEQIMEIIRAVSASNLTEFELQSGDFRLTMETNKTPVQAASAAVPVQTQKAQEPSVQAEEAVSEGNTVKSPLVGTFYEASAPGNAPLVQVGDTVKKGQVLGIVEAMKLMNEIESEYDGTVKEILVKNEQMVEFHQPMFVIG